MAIGWALSPRKSLGPAMQAEFEGHARAECFWAGDVPGAKESMGSIADRIRTGEVGDASELGSSTRYGRGHSGTRRRAEICGGAGSHAGLSECIQHSRQRQPVGPMKFNA